MSFTTKIVTGLVLGVLVGLFFGEYVAFLSILGEAFIGLLQMTVLPYILVSLIVNIGRLSPAKGWRLVRVGAFTLVGLLAIGVAVIVLAPLAFPQREAGSFFRSSLVEISQPFDFIGLYIPSNPFASLANSVVPAVVLFGILLGAAMIGIERKEALLGPLDILGDALNKLNKLVIRITPAGVFAIAGGTAGTMTPTECTGLSLLEIIPRRDPGFSRCGLPFVRIQ